MIVFSVYSVIFKLILSYILYNDVRTSSQRSTDYRGTSVLTNNNQKVITIIYDILI